MQQINLYQPILLQPKPLFSSAAIAQAWLLVFLALCLMHGYGRWQVAHQSALLAQLQTSRDVAESRYKELQLRVPRKTPDPRLVARARTLEADVVHARRLAEALDAGAFGNAAGLSRYLVALARQRVDGLWLTRIDIADGGRHLSLDGRTGEADKVPLLLQRLAREETFHSKLFGTMALTRDEHGVRFGVSTDAGTGKDGGDDAPSR